MRKIFLKVWNNKTFRQISYYLLITAAIVFLGLISQKIFNLNHLLEAFELKTYDLRLKISTLKKHKHNPNIVIVAIDDSSLEFLDSELGRYPWPRNCYPKIIDYMEKDDVDSILFDIMFIGRQKGYEIYDKQLAQAISKYKNIYISMNFDDRKSTSVAPVLSDKLKINLETKSKKINFSDFSFPYCRLINNEILKATDNIGFINLKLDETDSILRRCPTFFKYKDNYYPQLIVKFAENYIKRNEKVDSEKFIINEKNELLLANRKIPVDESASILLNWYGRDFTFEHVPFWKVYKQKLPSGYFKNKIVIIGVTAMSLYDIKSTSISSEYPGVEMQATLLNNILDNKFIKRVGFEVDALISLLLGFLVAMVVIKIKEPLISSFISLLILLTYSFAAYMILHNNLLWLGIIGPAFFMVLTYTVVFIIKYVLKSRDFEYTYKLATTDGLTELYNHRYFQEKLKEYMKKADKDGATFSVVLIDIDYFKKFNDTYGHQAGDEVLRQIGQVLKKSVKSSIDIVARYGGEEMVIILGNSDINSALSTADRICKTIAGKTFKLAESVEVNVTVSLGVATYPVHGTTAQEIIEVADKGLYCAKRNGRNQVGELYSINK